MSHPHDIADLFDKRRTYSRCFAAGVSLPKAFPGITTLDELQTQMIAQRRRRVFVKLAGGSSASGVAAYTIGPRGHRVLTTVEMVRVDGQWRYYNSRRLQLYESPEQIAQLLGYLLGQGAHIEDWVPKGSYNGATFDLRVVTIGGEPRHTIVRLSHGPMTNLHLLNRRCEVEGLRQLVPADSWERMLESVRRTAQAFPRCWMLGVDVAFTPTLRQHVVLEANAFGDQLPGLLDRGDDTYTAQFRAWQNRSDRLM